MQASYGRILRRAAVPTAAAAAVMIALSGAIGGVKGLTGALLGVALVIVFFGISVIAVGRAARVSPQAMMITALATYVLNMKNTYGVNLDAISVQNEPDQSVTYESCVWTAKQIHDFVQCDRK